MAKLHKLYSLDQLVQFCEENKFYSFNAKDTGYTLSVQVPGDLKFEKDSEQGLMFAKVKVCHTLGNRNGSYISEDNMKNAMPSLKYRPFLAYIHQLDSGEYDFHGHDVEIVNDEDGNEQVIYKESQVGTFTADDPYLEYDEEMDKTYVIATVAIPEDYTLAADIIRRKNGTKVSCELCINSMSYNAKNNYLELEDFYFSGCTALGSEKDGTEIGEGMLGSRLDIQDFSTENNSICTHYNTQDNIKLIEVIEKLNTTLSTLSIFNINKNADGKEEPGQMTKLEELLEKYGKTEEDLPFEYEGLTDEELEAAFSEAFDEKEPEIIEDNACGGKKKKKKCSETDPKENNACGGKKKKKKCSITEEDGTVHEFELSLDDISSALYNLVNDTYSESDNTWYGVSVYDSYVVMNDYWNNRNYRQTYNRDGDNFSLTGDRVEVFANWLTKDEEASLSDLRSNYSETKTELEKYQKAEEDKKKDELFTSEEYKNIFEVDEFKELKDNHADISYDNLVSKLDSMLLSYAKSGKFNFSAQQNPSNKPGKVSFNLDDNPVDDYKPYGDLFDK